MAYRLYEGTHEDQSTQNDPKLKSQIRRTRIKLLFEDFENELQYLESCNDEITRENHRLRQENTDLHAQLKEQETRYLQYLKRSAELDKEIMQNRSDVTDEVENSDISTIMKLSSKLQEVMAMNESITQTNTHLKQETDELRKERENYLEDVKQLKEEQKFINSPQKYNQYAIVALQTKVDNYEREVQRLKNALKKSDEYIEKLSLELEQYKVYGNRISPVFTALSSSNTGGTDSRVRLNQTSNTKNGDIYNDRSDDKNSSASATLQCLVRNNNDHNATRSPLFPPKRWNPDMISTHENKDNICVDNSGLSPNNKTTSTTTREVDKVRTNSDNDLLSDPSRFPACVKLLELTKACQYTTESLYSNYQDQNRQPSSSSSPRKSPSLSPSAVFPSTSRNRYSSNNNEQTIMCHRENDSDDITVVMPSESPWLQQQQPSKSISRNVSPDEYKRLKMLNKCSPDWSSPTSSTGNTDIRQTSRYISMANKYIDSNARTFIPPFKKIKSEVSYE